MKIRIFKTRSFRSSGVGAVIAALITASLLPIPNVYAQRENVEVGRLPMAQVTPDNETLVPIPSNSSATVGLIAAHSPSTPAAAPSLEEVVDLLQAQGQEIASLRAALREQQELTARLEAKLNAANPAIIVAEPPSPAPPPPPVVIGQ